MLKNIKLLDLSRIIVGPYATMVLSDYGFEVIKV
jgi:crotonobetainyl-CoA:carnitine CoA-transferase CaiB-like acyl-CoA transferase